MVYFLSALVSDYYPYKLLTFLLKNASINRDGEVKVQKAASFVVVAMFPDADNSPVVQCVFGTSNSCGR